MAMRSVTKGSPAALAVVRKASTLAVPPWASAPARRKSRAAMMPGWLYWAVRPSLEKNSAPAIQDQR